MLLLLLYLPSLYHSLPLSCSLSLSLLPVTLLARRDVKKLPVSASRCLQYFHATDMNFHIDSRRRMPRPLCGLSQEVFGPPFPYPRPPGLLCPLHAVVAVQFCGRCFMGSCCEFFLDFLVLFLDKPHITLHSGAKCKA